MSDIQRRPGFTFWATAVLVLLMPLYVLSSGPTRSLGASTWVGEAEMMRTDGVIETIPVTEISPGTWWMVAYAPLDWIAEQSWGEPLVVYWELFTLHE